MRNWSGMLTILSPLLLLRNYSADCRDFHKLIEIFSIFIETKLSLSNFLIRININMCTAYGFACELREKEKRVP